MNAGWIWIAGLTAVAACQRLPQEEVDDGIPGLDDTASSSGPAEPFVFPDVPAMERCWRWDSTLAAQLNGIAVATDGDVVVSGAQPPAIVRLSPDGEERWTLRPQLVALSSIAALPDGGFAVVGTYTLG